MKEITKKVIILCALLTISTIAALARDFAYNGITYTVIDEEARTVETKRGSNDVAGNILAGDIIIPQKVYENITAYTVVKISNSSFVGNYELTTIQLPSSITSIEVDAFKKCARLESITIPEGVKFLGGYAFLGCSSLQSVNLPNSVESIGYACFDNCESIIEVKLPNGLKALDGFCFSGCKKLKTINLPSSLNSIGTSAFENCSSLTELILPSNISHIGNSAFMGCSSLVQIEIPSKVYSIEERSFEDCSNLKNVKLPESLYSIGNRAFYSCKALTSIELPNSITSIGGYAFTGCSSLKTIDLPETITSLNEYTFTTCRSLSYVKLPNSITSIGGSAFSECSSLTSIDLPDALTSIGGSAFLGCSSLTSIDLPDAITSIGGSAFLGCSSLTSIDLPDAITSLDEWTFDCCRSLSYVKLPNSIKSIGKYAFNGCSSLKQVELPKSLKTIDEHAFEYSGIGQVISNSRDVVISENAFPKLSKCAYPSGIKNPFSIYDYAISFPVETSIIENGFIFNQNKSRIYLAPFNLEDDYVIPDVVKYIEPAAFANCQSLKTVTLPNNLIEIGKQAFAACTLKNIKTLNATPPVVKDEDAFKQNIYGTATLTVPDGCYEVYRKAAVWNKFIKMASTNGNIYVGELSVNPTEKNTWVSATGSLSVTIKPSDATNKDVRWSSSDETVVTVDNRGVFTATGRGLATLTATTTDGSNLSASCIVNVVQPVTSITIPESRINLKAGEYKILEASVLPENANDRSITWSSSDPSVARVENGVVFALNDGIAEIQAEANDGYGATAKCTITVGTEVSEIQLNMQKVTMKVGEFTTLTATVIPENASNKVLDWYSSDESVASVNDGLILAHSKGDVDIRVSATDGSGVYAECNVTVTDGSGIDGIDSDSVDDVEYYDIHGMKVAHPSTGLYIVKYKDGTVRKIVK